jgi:polyhydroxyalkanoate synthesis regulator phasin
MNTEHLSNPADPLAQTEREPALANTEPGEQRAVIIAGSGDKAARKESATSYLPDETSEQVSERWQHIQSEFVDDPRKTVSEAHELVGELMKRINDAFAKERGDLERQWSEGDSVSTEDLRVCLQRYRAFFSRLLPSVNGLDSH